MAEGITRREFIDGVACAVVAGSAMPSAARAQLAGATYPPARTGYGGSGPADFAIAHGIRDGRRYEFGSEPVAEHYDLVVVGSGIGGLAAAHYVRQARHKARILMLDNHDDFGGHARRNEFNVDGRFLLGYGGSESMEGPNRWTRVARSCVKSLGVDLDRFETAFNLNLYPGLGLSSGLFFPREVYGVDRLVTGDPVRSLPSDVPARLHNARPAAAFIADWPIDDGQKSRLLSLYTDTRDVLAGKSAAQKERLLATTSYRDYLQRYFGLDERALAMFDGRTLDYFASKAVAVPAQDAWASEYPGFQGLGLVRPRESSMESDPYIYHFPDGNASLARLFVRELLPGVAPGHGMDDIVSARFDYGRLDLPQNDVRLRLSSTAVAIANNRSGVDVLYAHGDRITRVAADRAIYAGYSAMLPYICPELGATQRKAVSDQVRAPLVYVNVAVRNWRAWVNRGVHNICNPAGFYTQMKLDYPVSLGDYHCPTHPDEPMILHLIHVPWPDGAIRDRRSAWRAARAMVYALRFDEFESHAHDELTRILGPGGFDADRDIAAITVNRWGHGYAYDPNPLFDDLSEMDREMSASTLPLGRIHFAGSDTAWMAYAHKAIDSAHRAATEITG
ncbi:MAG: NAD(P)-binding protein [Steroidobacterales bacterium]